MNLNAKEKEVILLLLKTELKNFEKEGKLITDNVSPLFLEAEEKYEDFLGNLMDKIKGN